MKPGCWLSCSQESAIGLHWTRSIQSISPHTIALRSILIWSSHLCLGLHCDLFPCGVHDKTVYAFLCLPMRATCSAHLILFMIILFIFVQGYKLWSSLLCRFNEWLNINAIKWISSNLDCNIQVFIFRQDINGAARRSVKFLICEWVFRFEIYLRLSAVIMKNTLVTYRVFQQFCIFVGRFLTVPDLVPRVLLSLTTTSAV
jgi:hypothetical protein